MMRITTTAVTTAVTAMVTNNVPTTGPATEREREIFLLNQLAS